MTTNYAHGHIAEQYAAAHLKQLGYKIIEINWKTRYCEIDIVAEKSSCIYFVEVKYRQTAAQGFGLDYITPKKLKQMTFAAEFWVQDHNWKSDYYLAAIEVYGDHNLVSELVIIE
ncbi:MAG: YraN family protein [Candidatus Saccharibacteria bacterium]|nr:YraN family protein [Candidatus Saccharibacteria bacterium]